MVGVKVCVEVGRGVRLDLTVDVGTGVFEGVEVTVLVNVDVTVGVRLAV